jgi:hypothetical protein
MGITREMVNRPEAGIYQGLLERVFDRIDDVVATCLESNSQGDKWIEIATRPKGRNENARHGVQPS